MEHPDPEVKQALDRLADAMCTWERETGKQSVFIFREVDGFVYRAVNGKSNVPEDIADDQLMKIIEDK